MEQLLARQQSPTSEQPDRLPASRCQTGTLSSGVLSCHSSRQAAKWKASVTKQSVTPTHQLENLLANQLAADP